MNMGSQINWYHRSSVLLLLLYMNPVYCTSKKCPTEKIQDFIIDIKSALLKGIKSNEPTHASTEEACLNLCCSHEKISGNKTCNFVTFDSEKTKKLPNCYLFYCPNKKACPLKSSAGTVSFRISQDEQGAEDDFTNQNLKKKSSGGDSSDSKLLSDNHSSTNDLQKSVTSQILDSVEDVKKDLEKIDDSHKEKNSPDKDHDGNRNKSNKTPLLETNRVFVPTTKAAIIVQPTTSTITSTAPVVTTTRTTTTTINSQVTTTSTATTKLATTRSTITTTLATMPPTTQPTTIPTTARATTTSITIQHPALTSSSIVTPTIQLTIGTTSLTYPTTITSASSYPVLKKFRIDSLRPSLRPPTATTKSATASVGATGIVSSPYIEWISSKENQIVNNQGGGNGVNSQTSNRSGLVAALCFGVAFLLLIILLVGKAVLESLQRRQYSRLDYLINGMYVDT